MVTPAIKTEATNTSRIMATKILVRKDNLVNNQTAFTCKYSNIRAKGRLTFSTRSIKDHLLAGVWPYTI